VDHREGEEAPLQSLRFPSVREWKRLGTRAHSWTRSLIEPECLIEGLRSVLSRATEPLDPLGFGFENFDAIGRWREEAEGVRVDSGGTLPSGESFSGPIELVRILKKRKRGFVEVLTEKMLTYALGRGLEIPDSCAVDDIVADLEKNDYRFTVLVRGIVHSKPFLKRRGDSGATK